MRLLIFLVEFIIVSVLSNIADSIVMTISDKGTAFYEWFLLLLVSGTAVGVITHVCIYGVYYILSLWIMSKTSPFLGYCAIIIIGLFYILVVTLGDYYFFSNYERFGKYLSEGSHFSLYVFTAVIVCIAMRALSKKEIKQKG